MTVLVGVRCTDGVVIGSDSIATSAIGTHPLVHLPTDKLVVVGDRIILAGTGAVGLGQRFQSIVRSHWDKKMFQKPCLDCLKSLSTAAINDFGSTGVQGRPNGFGYGALLAAPMDGDCWLTEFGVSDFQPEQKIGKLFFVSMGSGQMLADPFLAFISRVLWKGTAPNVREAMFGVYWVLNHTIKYAPGGVGDPIKLAILQKSKDGWNARVLEDDELQEKSEFISAIEEEIGKYPASLIDDAKAVEVPTVPS